MREVSYHGRRAIQIENGAIRATLTLEGGHLAELLHKPTGVNPLWKPHWRSIEPSTYDPAKHPEYGSNVEAQLLSGILGHNICLDVFGAPSAEELAAGISVHGEGPIARYEASAGSNAAILKTTLDKAQLQFKRRVSLNPESFVLHFHEELGNLTAFERPIAWTQHVTLGAPFLERGRTQFRVSANRSKVIDSDFNEGLGAQQPGAEFQWPLCPRKGGGSDDLSVFTGASISGGFTAHLMNPEGENAWFVAWSPTTRVAIGYVWARPDFPWLARWEENHLRTQPPWNGQGLACGMEFGVSPMVESRRKMVDRHTLFGVPTFRWIAARQTLAVDYCAFVTSCDSAPSAVEWDGADGVQLGL